MQLPATLKLLFCASLLVFPQFSAYAHTALKESTPSDGAIVKTPPAHLNLVFTEPVVLIKLELLGVGHEMPTKFEPAKEPMAAYRIESPGMGPGEFTVNWAVIGADGHTVTNSYSFVVDPNATEGHAASHDDGGHGHGGAAGHH